MKKKRFLALLCSVMLVVQGVTPAAAEELTIYEETGEDVNVVATQEDTAADVVSGDEGDIFIGDIEEASENNQADNAPDIAEALDIAEEATESTEELPSPDGDLEVEEDYALAADTFEEELVPEDVLVAEETELLLEEEATAGETGDVLEEVPAEEEDLPELLEEDALNYDDPALAGATDASGTCGENLNWTLSGGTLTITGTGDMTNYMQGRAPWDAYSDQITAVSIGTEVTSIGDYAFYYCRNLPEIVIPDRVTSIGSYAFQKCSSLKKVKTGNGVRGIGYSAFRECDKLENIEFSPNLMYIYGSAFYQCANWVLAEPPK